MLHIYSSSDTKWSEIMLPKLNQRQRQLALKILLCTVVGIGVGATAARAENNACLLTEMPAAHCLQEDPQINVLKGMANGAFACLGALGAIEIGQRWLKL